jgi:hypothetical protein
VHHNCQTEINEYELSVLLIGPYHNSELPRPPELGACWHGRWTGRRHTGWLAAAGQCWCLLLGCQAGGCCREGVLEIRHGPWCMNGWLICHGHLGTLSMSNVTRKTPLPWLSNYWISLMLLGLLPLLLYQQGLILSIYCHSWLCAPYACLMSHQTYSVVELDHGVRLCVWHYYSPS